MSFMTARKRAEGMGSARAGSEHHWQMIVTSVALLVLVPSFVFTFGRALGMPYDEAVAYMGRPWPAAVAVLTLGIGFYHFAKGAQVMIEDYVGGIAREIAVIATYTLSAILAGLGIVSLGIIAF